MQNTGTIDIRKVKTRKSIIESFNLLMQKKRFDSIRVSDITTTAMINRATFYDHFADKYELFEVATKEGLLQHVKMELDENKTFCENTLKNIFLSLTRFHHKLSDTCSRNYTELTANTDDILRVEVKQVLLEILKPRFQFKKQSELENTASLLSWMLVGAAFEWKSQSHQDPETYFDQTMKSILQTIQL